MSKYWPADRWKAVPKLSTTTQLWKWLFITDVRSFWEEEVTESTWQQENKECTFTYSSSKDTVHSQMPRTTLSTDWQLTESENNLPIDMIAKVVDKWTFSLTWSLFILILNLYTWRYLKWTAKGLSQSWADQIEITRSIVAWMQSHMTYRSLSKVGPHSSRAVGHSNKQKNNFEQENIHNRFALHCF